MDPLSPEEKQRLRSLADSLDCFTEDDLKLLAKSTSGTTESWRKRNQGPEYALVGNAYLYPKKSVAEWVQSKVRSRHRVSAKEML